VCDSYPHTASLALRGIWKTWSSLLHSPLLQGDWPVDDKHGLKSLPSLCTLPSLWTPRSFSSIIPFGMGFGYVTCFGQRVIS
jgi:hypothetical protein